MSVSTRLTKSHTLAGETFAQSVVKTTGGTILHKVSVPVAEPGTLTTRTDADTGVVTITNASHTIENADRVDAYWTEAGVEKSRYGMAVTNVSSALVTIDGGAGDDLPSQDDAISVSVCVRMDVDIAGDSAKAIVLGSAKRGQFAFVGGATEHYARTVGEGRVITWEDEDGSTNPIVGDTIDTIYASHKDELASREMKVGIAYDNA